MNTAVKGFESWDTAPGLKKVADTWDRQVAVLMGRLAPEESALRGASGLFVIGNMNDAAQYGYHGFGGLITQFPITGNPPQRLIDAATYEWSKDVVP
ncbi:hypothetical protein ACFXJO_25080 [Streptomyces lavendulae]|uniref:hypothetical protein n=1 Tax=Streptomyces lavendulae TaxID=1914 RepID=UPI0036C249D7